eukprot:14224936-Alexandrium_andersonii.AAC.1
MASPSPAPGAAAVIGGGGTVRRGEGITRAAVGSGRHRPPRGALGGAARGGMRREVKEGTAGTHGA